MFTLISRIFRSQYFYRKDMVQIIWTISYGFFCIFTKKHIHLAFWSSVSLFTEFGISWIWRFFHGARKNHLSLEFWNLLFRFLNLYKDQVKGFAIDINRHKESPDNIIHFELLNAEKRKEIESIAENAVNRSLGLATTDTKKSTIIGTR